MSFTSRTIYSEGRPCGRGMRRCPDGSSMVPPDTTALLEHHGVRYGVALGTTTGSDVRKGMEF